MFCSLSVRYLLVLCDGGGLGFGKNHTFYLLFLERKGKADTQMNKAPHQKAVRQAKSTRNRYCRQKPAGAHYISMVKGTGTITFWNGRAVGDFGYDGWVGGWARYVRIEWNGYLLYLDRHERTSVGFAPSQIQAKRYQFLVYGFWLFGFVFVFFFYSFLFLCHLHLHLPRFWAASILVYAYKPWMRVTEGWVVLCLLNY